MVDERLIRVSCNRVFRSKPNRNLFTDQTRRLKSWLPEALLQENEDLRIGVLLRRFELVSEAEVNRALELADDTALPLGKILEMLDCLSPESLRSIIEIQSLLRDGLLSMRLATRVIDVVQRKHWSVNDALILLGGDATATRGTKLGELLQNSNVVEEDKLKVALRACSSSGIPLGRVLVLLDTLPESSVRQALQVQTDLRMGHCEIDESLDKLKHLQRTEVSRPILQPKKGSDQQNNRIKLGELLLMAEIAKISEIESAVDMATANEKLMGEVLVEFGWVDDQMLQVCLKVQQLVWSDQLSIAKATDILRLVNSRECTLEQAMNRYSLGPTDFQKRLTLYDFLRLSGYMTRDRMRDLVQTILDKSELTALVMKHARGLGQVKEGILKEAIKQGVADNALLEDLILKTYRDDAAMLQNAITLHNRVRDGKIRVDHALVSLALKCETMTA